ncbi:hypothetical protein MRB53_039201 [Persea americana]|nr:hypothetical protein MRB53_039201 [Persea americana]
MSEHDLTAGQQHALFHFLCHAEAFTEFTSLKIPGRIAAYGPPFLPNPKFAGEPPSPILEKCTRHFVMTDTLPAFCAVKNDSDFWGGKVQKILENMAESTLSDSYDKGKVSKRKILGMAVSVFLANISRGLFGKVAADQDAPSETKDYHTGAELIEAWRRWKIGMIYGQNLTEALDLLEHDVAPEEFPVHQRAAYEYIKITLASLLYYIFVSSPDADDTLSLLSRLHSKLPYWSIRQALKVPYATSMVSAMVKLFLAKPMFGGKSLLQTLISTILGQDQTRCEKGIAKLKKDMSEKSTKLLDGYVYDTDREAQIKLREQSMNENISIAAVIVGTDLSEAEHSHCLKYLELSLARRDRIELIRILTGDEVLTGLVRAGLDVFFPVIEDLHKAVSLPEGLGDLQNFLGDLISSAEQKSSINGFIDLMTKHQGSFNKFARQILKNSPSMKKGYMEWYKHCLLAYTGTPAMDLKSCLAQVDDGQRSKILQELKVYESYIEEKRQVSESRLDGIPRKQRHRRIWGMAWYTRRCSSRC